MNEYVTDNNGVPILGAPDIEKKAEQVIKHFRPALLDTPCHIPLLEFIEELHEKYGVQRSYHLDLGESPQGRKILGRTRLKPLDISIDQCLQNDPRFPFTLAHEFGHLVFHRGIDFAKTGYANQEITDTEIDMLTGKKVLKTPRDWIEWHANYFAAALLMPRATFHEAVASAQHELGITHNVGCILLTNKGYSQVDYIKTNRILQKIYGVNQTNVEYRLSELGILIDHRDEDVSHISELFSRR